MRFNLSGNLLRFSNYEREIEVEGNTVYDGLQRLVECHPPLQPVLFDTSDQVRGVLQIFLDGVPVEHEELKKGISPDADVTILTALAGG